MDAPQHGVSVVAAIRVLRVNRRHPSREQDSQSHKWSNGAAAMPVNFTTSGSVTSAYMCTDEWRLHHARTPEKVQMWLMCPDTPWPSNETTYACTQAVSMHSHVAPENTGLRGTYHVRDSASLHNSVQAVGHGMRRPHGAHAVLQSRTQSHPRDAQLDVSPYLKSSMLNAFTGAAQNGTAFIEFSLTDAGVPTSSTCAAHDFTHSCYMHH